MYYLIIHRILRIETTVPCISVCLSVTLTVCLSLGEALGAIGDPVVLDLLKEYSEDPVVEVGIEHLAWNYQSSGIGFNKHNIFLISTTLK